MQPFIYTNKKTFLIILILLAVIFGMYFITQNRKPNTEAELAIPPTSEWKRFDATEFGFNFMNPDNLEVKVNNDTMTVGDITVNIDRLSCKNPKPKEMLNPITIYGYKTMINEAENFAYICNNTNTACLDIYSNRKNKTTEGFFHAFISTLNINEAFDKIGCE